MKLERRQKIKQLRQRLANLNEEDKQAIIRQGIIKTVEGRTLSLANTLLVYLQCNGRLPTVVGGYQQWRKAGKQVKRGEHGFMIWFPVGDKDEDTGDIIAPETFYTATVFDISQVEDK